MTAILYELTEIYETQIHILEAKNAWTLDQADQYLRDHAKDPDGSFRAERWRDESTNVAGKQE